MTVGTVGSYSILQTALTNVAKVEADLSKQQIQLSSGNKSSDFAGIASDSQQFLSLDNILAKTDQYLSDNKVVEIRVNATSTALTNIIGTLNSLQGLISSRMSGTQNSAAFDKQLQGIWQDITGQLNSSINNQFLFSGTKTNSKAVDSDKFPTLQISGVPDSGYYLGNTQDMVVRAQDDTTIKYNTRADDIAFQQVFAALAVAKDGAAISSTTQLKQAEDLLQSGIQGIIGLQANVGAVSSQLSKIDTNLTSQKLYWKGIQESIGNTDMVSVSTAVASNQGILQAAFQAFAKITSLRLADYLK